MIKKELAVVLLSNSFIAILIYRLIENEFFPLFLQLCIVILGLSTIKLITNFQSLTYFYIFLLLGFYALTIELISIKTGFPYSKFVYKELMGLKILGIVPWSVFFVWPTLVISAVSIAGQFLKKKVAMFLISIAILLLLDLVFDPVATKLGFWEWQNSGLYYDVPFVNFLGWIFSSVLSVGIIFIIGKRRILTNKYLSYVFLGNLFLWTILNLIIGLYIPHLIGLFLLVIIIILAKSQKYV